MIKCIADVSANFWYQFALASYEIHSLTIP